MKKKIGAALVSGVLACSMTVGLAFSSGCTSQITEFEMPEGGYDGSYVEITFAECAGANLTGIIEAEIPYFNELYPNIKVNIDNNAKNYDALNERITTQLTSQKQPNIAFCYSDHVVTYKEANAVLALDDFLPGGAYDGMTVTNTNGTESLGLTQAQVDDYVPAFLNEGRVYEDGKMYTLPFAKSTEVLYYNADFFEANNLHVPTTWEEMAETCEAILDIIGDDKSKYPLGYDSDANLFITMCEQHDSPYTSVKEGEHFQFDNEKNHEFVEMLNDWFKKGYFITQSTNNNTYSSNLFTKEDCFMSIGSTGGSSYQDPGSTDGVAAFNVGVAPIPQIDPSNPKSILQGPSVCIFKSANPQEVIASWLFVKYLTTSIGFQAYYCEVSGYTPVIESAFNDPSYQSFLAGNSLIARTSLVCRELVKNDAFYLSAAFVGSSKAREQVGLLMKTVLTGGDINKAFSDALTECRYFAGN